MPSCRHDRGAGEKKKLLHTFIEFPILSGLIAFVEQLLSTMGRVQLLHEFIIKIVPLLSPTEVFCVVTTKKQYGRHI